jgi:hypothetical protein
MLGRELLDHAQPLFRVDVGPGQALWGRPGFERRLALARQAGTLRSQVGPDLVQVGRRSTGWPGESLVAEKSL